MAKQNIIKNIPAPIITDIHVFALEQLYINVPIQQARGIAMFRSIDI
jgi:hypothetical protein